MKATVSATRTSARTSEKTARGGRTAQTRGRTTAASRALARRAQRAGAPVEETKTRERVAAARQRAPFVAGIIALLSGGLVVTLFLTTRATQGTYELEKAAEHNQRLAAELAQLQRDVEAAEAAPELAAKARQIGMVPSSDPAHLVVGKDGKVTLVGTPTPAAAAPAPLMNTTRAIIVSDPAAGGESLVSRTESSSSTTSETSTSASGGTPQTGNTAAAHADGEQLVPVTAGSDER